MSLVPKRDIPPMKKRVEEAIANLEKYYLNMVNHKTTIFFENGKSVTLMGYKKTPRVEYKYIPDPKNIFEYQAEAIAVRDLPYPIYQGGVRMKLIVSRECLRATRAIEKKLIAEYKLKNFLEATPNFKLRGNTFEQICKKYPEFAELIGNSRSVYNKLRLYLNRKDLRCSGKQRLVDGKVVGCDGLMTEFE